MSVHTELVYALVSGSDGQTLHAMADSLEGILNAAATLRDEGEPVDSMIVEKAGHYDPATTALIQENAA